MNRQKVIVIAVIVFLLMFMVIYTMSVVNRNKEKETVSAEFSAPDLVEEKREEYKSRMERLNIKTYEDIELTTDLDFSLFNDTTPENKDTVETIAEIQKPKQEPKAKPKQRKSRKKKAKKIEKDQQTVSETVKEPKPNYGGAGILINESKPIEEVKETENKYIPAYLEETTEFYNTASVVFRLESDTEINDKLFRKGSVLFGQATVKNHYFDVIIETIKGHDNKIYPVGNYIVYNENYLRGVKHEGNLDKSIKEGNKQTLNNVTNSVGSGVVGTGASLVAEGTKNIVQKATQKREIKAKYGKGYKIFIKKIGNEKM